MGSMAPPGAGAVVARALPASRSAPSMAMLPRGSRAKCGQSYMLCVFLRVKADGLPRIDRAFLDWWWSADVAGGIE